MLYVHEHGQSICQRQRVVHRKKPVKKFCIKRILSNYKHNFESHWYQVVTEPDIYIKWHQSLDGSWQIQSIQAASQLPKLKAIASDTFR